MESNQDHKPLSQKRGLSDLIRPLPWYFTKNETKNKHQLKQYGEGMTVHQRLEARSCRNQYISFPDQVGRSRWSVMATSIVIIGPIPFGDPIFL